MNKINYCIVVPDDVNLDTEVYDNNYALYKILKDILKTKFYNTVPTDICHADLYWENNNLIFKHKAVPATAATMSSFPYYYALVIKEHDIVK